MYKIFLKKKEIARLPEARNLAEIREKESEILSKEQIPINKLSITEQKNDIKCNENINDKEKINKNSKLNLEQNTETIENVESKIEAKNIEQEKNNLKENFYEIKEKIIRNYKSLKEKYSKFLEERAIK